MKKLTTGSIAFVYRHISKPLLFMWDPEIIHDVVTKRGELLGKFAVTRYVVSLLLQYKNKGLRQHICGITFENPIGLAAGFDYRAQLTQILPSLGFGFGTVGTITNIPYIGNPKPRLGRLLASKSLMVNKGFKNEGVRTVMRKLKDVHFTYPVGISIGRTNMRENYMSLEESIADILSAFRYVESSDIPFAYYELNISCPNLFGNISFYLPKNLRTLLTAVTKLNLKKPLFIKMPINNSDKEIVGMLDSIVQFPVQGVIFGNLQKNRSDPGLIKTEVEKFSVGNFSGKPTEKRSNELIKLAYKLYGKKLIIIGCGGVFSAEDAYRKIRLGASLVELITGLVFEGPQLASEINQKLIYLLRRDGFSHIAEAVGKDL